jgi:hypothetical protein
MDYRTEAFQRKFHDAARHLNVRPQQLVSLKLRENVNSYGEYREFLHELERTTDLKSSPADGDLQGHGYLVSDGKVKVIVVEHETGLEILYIAGSIASLVGLVPLLLQGWRAFRGRHARHEMHPLGIELRRLDEGGHIFEEQVHDMFSYAPMPGGFLNAALASAAKLVEADFSEITRQLRSLTMRVEELERLAKPKTKGRKSRTSMKSTAQPAPASPDAKLAHLVKKPDNETRV